MSAGGTEPGRRVLILEDEFMIAMEFETVVLDAGFDVLGPFSDAESALATIETERPVAAILDVNLGHGATSLPVAERLSELNVPFVLCTGYQTADLVQRFGERVPILQKPVDTALLVELLGKIASPGT